MSPIESRNNTNTNRVRMFENDKLSKPVAEQKQDRVKVVCTQPFNKHTSYGLSFITFNALGSSDETSSDSTKKLGHFTVKEDDDETISIGSLFAKRKEKPAAIPAAGWYYYYQSDFYKTYFMYNFFCAEIDLITFPAFVNSDTAFINHISVYPTLF